MKSQFRLATVERGHLVDMKMTLKFELNHVGNITQRLNFFFTKVLELPSTLAVYGTPGSGQLGPLNALPIHDISRG